ncbi:hypothetical protein JL100_035015 (plasmid) [Skermanella mucosa]|uniref:hypothetical protein n=1 Tax=Skermanella mucosa TaxID=1789672 RepID=UPI00192BA8A8|nr:hypothetical protein [Skermanella mucosa]UEM25274.1 hypothetical protein JL100_035015 [Skermanella mucosa]
MTQFSAQALLSLVALAAGGTVLAQGLEWRPDVSVAPPAPHRVERPVEPARDDAGPIDALVEALHGRPLFTPGRRPPEPVAESPGAVPAVAADSDTFPPVPEVRGTATSADRSVAIVLDPADNRLRRVAAGDEVGGWTVLGIYPGKIQLRSDRADAVVYAVMPGGESRRDVTPRVGGRQAAVTAAPGAEGF